MFLISVSRGCPCFSYMANRKQGSITRIITNAARLVPVLPLSKKKSGNPTRSAAAKKISCRFVRLKATFVLMRDRSFGTGTYAIEKISFRYISILFGSSLPHISHPGVFCRANSSIRGKSPIRATIFSRAASGFLLCCSMGLIRN